MKSIDTLVPDIYELIGNGGIIDHLDLGARLSDLLRSRLSEEREQRRTLRLSNVGQPCARKLWYSTRDDVEREDLSPRARGNFLFGDILEEVLLGIADASGHDVSGRQDEIRVGGIVGHRDAVIDGVLVDVKSASGRAFTKFKSGTVPDDDPFGYLWQLAGYLYGSQDDPLVRDKTRAGFLVWNKENGEICLDLYDMTPYLAEVPGMIEDRKAAVLKDMPPDRAFSPVPEGKSGNTKLPVNCSYCDFKKACWPEARKFIYSTGPRWLVDVVREPDVMEIVE